MLPLLYNLNTKTIMIVGCGGLGCYVAELLARCNVKRIIIMDDDVFNESNMNRQLYCTKETLKQPKVTVAKERIEKISETEVVVIKDKFPKAIEDDYFNCCADVIIDCLDNIAGRLLLEEYAYERKVPLIHGAIDGLFGQIAVIYPGDYTLKKIYKNYDGKPSETISVTPCLVASLMVNETLKVLQNIPSDRGEMILVDLTNTTLRKIKV